MILDDFMASPVLMALAGAIVGGMRAGVMSWRAHGGWRAFVDGLIGVVFALSMADWLTPPHYPKLAGVIGLLAGTTGARALDAAFELVPEFLRELLIGWARKATGSGGVDKIKRNTGWGDLPSGRFTRDEDRIDNSPP